MVTIAIDFAFVLTILSIIVAIITIILFLNTRKKVAMMEGAKEEQFKQVKEDLKIAFDDIKELKKKTSCTDNDITEIKTNVKTIMDSINKIMDKLFYNEKGSE